MQKVKMIESLISCQTRNHQDQEAFVYVLDDDFNPEQRLLCQSCFNDQSNPLLTINPQQTQSRIQELQELVYDQVEDIVLSITGSKTSLNSLKNRKIVGQCFDNLFQDYQNDLLRIQRDNSEYSFHMEIQNIQQCLFQTENFDQVLEKYYIKKITQEVEKIQACQSNYICLFDKQLNLERTIDELIFPNQCTIVDEVMNKINLLQDEVICRQQDEQEKNKAKLSDLDAFRYNVTKEKTISKDFNIAISKLIMISENFPKVNIKNEKTKKFEISLEENEKTTMIRNKIIIFIQNFLNNYNDKIDINIYFKQMIGNLNNIEELMNIENLLSEVIRQINISLKIKKNKMNKKIISSIIQKLKQSSLISIGSVSEIDEINIEKLLIYLKGFYVDRMKQNYKIAEQYSKYFAENKIFIQTENETNLFFEDQFIGLKFLSETEISIDKNMIIRIIKNLEQLFGLLFLNNKEIVYFCSNVFQIYYQEFIFENDEWSTWLKIEKYILIGSEILIRAEFIKIYVNIKRKYQQSQDSNNICDQL